MLAEIPLAGAILDENNDQPEPQDFPRVARGRNNLTALSSVFDLYFVAYGDEIHVFQPRRSPQILGSPGVILQPPTSEVAKMVLGGYQDAAKPHQMYVNSCT